MHTRSPVPSTQSPLLGVFTLPRLLALLLLAVLFASCRSSDQVPEPEVFCTEEPLALIACEARCAAPGEQIDFSGAASADPQGSALSYRFDFGDGETVSGAATARHAFREPGAYRVVLTVANQGGLVDQSNCIVSVGSFPRHPGTLDTVALAPSFYRPEVREPSPRPDHGGLIYGFFVAPFDAVPDTILVNGVEGIAENGKVDWCEIAQEELRAGEIGVLRCHSYSSSFDAGRSIELEVREGTLTIWSTSAVLPEPSLTPSSITASRDGGEILVHTRNDAGFPIRVQGLAINGQDVSRYAVMENPDLLPGQAAILRVPQCDGVVYGEWTVFTVYGSGASGPVSDSRALRLFPPVFPVGNWNSAFRNFFEEPASLDKQLGLGINLFIYDPTDSASLWGPEEVLAWAEDRNFYLFTHQGEVGPEFERFIREYGGHPRILTNAVSGEGESADPLAAQRVLDKLRLHRRLWGREKPLWIYNNQSYQFPSWGALADISGMDHYCVFAAKINTNWPFFFWDRIEFAGTYAEVIKRAAEPGPVWNWTQALWNDSDLEGLGDLLIRCTTAEEIRAQWYMVLSRGTRGLLWFLFREEWDEACPEEPQEEMGRLVRELRSVEGILLEGEVSTPGSIASTGHEKVDVSATVSPGGIVVFLINLDYALKLIAPWVWQERDEVEIDLRPPGDFEPAAFYRLDNGSLVDLPWERQEPGLYRCTLPSLKVAEAMLVLPEP